LGFELAGGGAQLNLDKAALDTAVQNFGLQLQGAAVALFYYAGHGVQVHGANYLVPINANPTREVDVDFQMLEVNLVLRQMEASRTRLNLVILDACRNNPFGGRGLRGSEPGLAQMQAPEGTVISYATQPGNVAQDGADGDSPFTKALAAIIRRPGLDVFQTFNEVGVAVQHATAGAQQPWFSSSPIDGTFYFVAPVPPTTTAPPPPANAATFGAPMPQAEQRGSNGAITVEAAITRPFSCNGRNFLLYEYTARPAGSPAFRAIAPPDWGHPLGGHDFKTAGEAVAVACL